MNTKLLLYSVALLISSGYAQSDKFGWVLDSTKWVPHDTLFQAKVVCTHNWVFQSDSASYLYGGYLRQTNLKSAPPFWQEIKTNRTYFYENQRRICERCLTEIAEHLVKYWRRVSLPKTEFELLKDKQKLLLNKSKHAKR
jgi:hypothetical protein